MACLRAKSAIQVIVQRIRCILWQVGGNDMNELAPRAHAAQALQFEVRAMLHLLSWNVPPLVEERVQVLLSTLREKNLVSVVIMVIIGRVLLVDTNHNVRGEASVQGKCFLVTHMCFLPYHTREFLQGRVNTGARASTCARV
jgi:hypothetical protein